jgi:hypothetical protein
MVQNDFSVKFVQLTYKEGEEKSQEKGEKKLRSAPIQMAVLLIVFIFLGCNGSQKEGMKSNAIKGGTSANPSLFEVRQQCNEMSFTYGS